MDMEFLLGVLRWSKTVCDAGPTTLIMLKTTELYTVHGRIV